MNLKHNIMSEEGTELNLVRRKVVKQLLDGIVVVFLEL